MAAVNITSRDEHFQNYSPNGKLSSSKASNLKGVFDETGEQDDGMIHCENSRASCASPTDEYVDINEMEFIKSTDKAENNILMRRTRRRRTKKTEERKKYLDSFVIENNEQFFSVDS